MDVETFKTYTWFAAYMKIYRQEYLPSNFNDRKQWQKETGHVNAVGEHSQHHKSYESISTGSSHANHELSNRLLHRKHKIYFCKVEQMHNRVTDRI
uniref:Uncharacterized protein n=1 Tax=Rhizophagus irregularis (strain DAOM 181602 / DAOM 197198 / MUCL 43194) TaxID=747089 RepID=U9STQ0_RHIID